MVGGLIPGGQGIVITVPDDIDADAVALAVLDGIRTAFGTSECERIAVCALDTGEQANVVDALRRAAQRAGRPAKRANRRGRTATPVAPAS